MKKIITGALAALAMTAAVPASAASASNSRYCGRTPSSTAIMAVGPTSCPFARRVVRRVYSTVPTVELRPGMWGFAARTIRVFSPVTERNYRMRCRTVWPPESPYYACTGGNGARVEIRS